MVDCVAHLRNRGHLLDSHCRPGLQVELQAGRPAFSQSGLGSCTSGASAPVD